MYLNPELDRKKFKNLIIFIYNNTDLNERFDYEKLCRLIFHINYKHFSEIGRNICDVYEGVFDFADVFDYSIFTKREISIMRQLCQEFFRTSAKLVKFDSYEISEELLDYLTDPEL